MVVLSWGWEVRDGNEGYDMVGLGLKGWDGMGMGMEIEIETELGL